MSDGWIGYVNEPEGFEAALQCARRASHTAGNGIEAGASGQVVNEGGKTRGIGDVDPALHTRRAAVFASPPGSSFAGGAVAFHLTAAVAAWLVL